MQALVVKPTICPLELTVRAYRSLLTVGRAANGVSADGCPVLLRRNW
jgi:hypothetical protein